jgi:glycosyltransferase involved in cell wall biosynthesis
MVIVESLIVGRPVVSTDCPTGPNEILINNLSKWLVPIRDPKALAEKIDLALDTQITMDEKDLNRFNKEQIYKDFELLWKK